MYHAGSTWFPGGYIGVDVFFVLSGFLITRILVDELAQDGRIDFRRFYLRRIRRLFPALLCTIIVSYISGGAAILSFSNIFFWYQADYFDALATTKPLLHTWSLSVEEQFYVIWPFLLFALWRFLNKAGIIFVIILLSMMSLLCAEWLLERD